MKLCKSVKSDNHVYELESKFLTFFKIIIHTPHMKINYKTLPPSVFSFIFCFFAYSSVAQKDTKPNPDAVKLAIAHVVKNAKQLNLTEQDVKNMLVDDSYTTDHNGLTHVFLIQHHQSIELANGIINVNVMPNGEILSMGNRFMNDLANRINETTPTLSPQAAVEAACKHLNVALPQGGLVSKLKKSDKTFIFDKGKFVLSDIKVKLCFEKINDKKAQLAWDLNIDQPDGQNHWSMRVDALTGAILDKNSWTQHCSFDNHIFGRDQCEENHPLSLPAAKAGILPKKTKSNVESPSIGGGNYNVFALPIESPSFGDRSIVSDPADAAASPYGWHDINGIAGADTTITLGNNVHAYLDIDNDNVSDSFEPDGGSNLNFDFPFNTQGEPSVNRQAATTNLFYMNNMMHDILHHYGFDEKSGNFQEKNYKGELGGRDYVLAEAQDNSVPTSSARYNNANFSTPPDGANPRMQMYLWNLQPTSKILSITAPQALIGSFETGTATFGAAITETPITGEVVTANDGTLTPTLACSPLKNTNLTGKIALIDRGGCLFIDKVLNAQNKGAIACIVCNIEAGIINMGGTNSALKIPSVSISKADCDRIRAATGNGLKVTLAKPPASTGPTLLDGDFDNSIIAHEYGHGVSMRLTGGRNRTDCLNTSELKSGEGWSDFLALAFTTKATDRNRPRGLGTYAERQSTDGVGIRTYRYSTDMSVNPLTYDDLLPEQNALFPHKSGEVWMAPLWDMYWAMVDVYGFDSNMKNTKSGNGRAVQLVIDGMKLQPCNPGFLDARDAILAADRANYGGQNQKLIWDAFARRGMGYNATQGTSTRKDDNTEGFESSPFFSNAIFMKKTMTESIKAGETITVKLKINNYKTTTATGLVITDPIPQGATYVLNSSSSTVTNNNGVLTWNIPSIAVNDSLTITYRLSTDASKKSIATFLDDMENGDAKWDIEELENPPSGNLWEIVDFQSKSGSKSWGVGYPAKGLSDQVVYLRKPIAVTGTKPVLRFFHNINSEPIYDAGIVQISKDGGANWEFTDDKVFKNPYRGKVNYSTFATPNIKGYWGITDTFQSSCIDLSSYIGKNIQFRFRFGADSTQAGSGWFIDDVAVMDMFNYTSKARVITAQKDTTFAEAQGRGSIVEPTVFTATNDILSDLKVKVFPNPTSDVININIINNESVKAKIELVSVDGKVVYQSQTELLGTHESVIPIDVSTYPSGIYFAKVQTDKKVIIEKIVKQ
jgi:extracellular elastinolytic metalloproteinase